MNREQLSNATNRVGDGRISDNASGFAIFLVLKNVPHHHEHSEWIAMLSFIVSHVSSTQATETGSNATRAAVKAAWRLHRIQTAGPMVAFLPST
jgi:hypothetical protein